MRNISYVILMTIGVLGICWFQVREIARRAEKKQLQIELEQKQAEERSACVQSLKNSLAIAENAEAKVDARLAALKEISEALQKEHPYSKEAGGGTFKIVSNNLGKEQGEPWLGELRRKVESLQKTPQLFNELVAIERKAKISKEDAERAKELRNKIHKHLRSLEGNHLGLITYTTSDNALARIEDRAK